MIQCPVGHAQGLSNSHRLTVVTGQMEGDQPESSEGKLYILSLGGAGSH
jgi:hypothetical protein